jgi:hypothetical protein
VALSDGYVQKFQEPRGLPAAWVQQKPASPFLLLYTPAVVKKHSHCCYASNFDFILKINVLFWPHPSIWETSTVILDRSECAKPRWKAKQWYGTANQCAPGSGRTQRLKPSATGLLLLVSSSLSLDLCSGTIVVTHWWWWSPRRHWTSALVLLSLPTDMTRCWLGGRCCLTVNQTPPQRLLLHLPSGLIGIPQVSVLAGGGALHHRLLRVSGKSGKGSRDAACNLPVPKRDAVQRNVEGSRCSSTQERLREIARLWGAPAVNFPMQKVRQESAKKKFSACLSQRKRNVHLVVDSLSTTEIWRFYSCRRFSDFSNRDTNYAYS